jgi:hypothetical protein
MSDPQSPVDPCLPAPCSICGRVMAVHLDSIIRIHGPKRQRCDGSKQPSGIRLNAGYVNSEKLVLTVLAPSTSRQPPPLRKPQFWTPPINAVNPGCILLSLKILKRILRTWG